MANRKREIQKTLIRIIGVAGIITVAVLAPNAFQVLGMLDRKKKNQYKNTVNRSVGRLIAKGLVEETSNGIKLSLKGKRRLAIENASSKNHELRKWDGKWRIIIFDIPEKRKRAREQVREILVKIGFVRLQDSVWVYPYDCEEILELFKVDLYLEKHLVSIVAESIENDANLKRIFGLNK